MELPDELFKEVIKRLEDPVWLQVRILTTKIIQPEAPTEGFYNLSRLIYIEVKNGKTSA